MKRKYSQSGIRYVLPSRDKLTQAMGFPKGLKPMDNSVIADHPTSKVAMKVVKWSEEAQRSARKGLMLLGPPGLGKTTLVGEACLRIADRRIREALALDNQEELLKWNLRFLPEYQAICKANKLMNPAPVQYWSWAQFWDRIQKTSKRATDPYTDSDFWDEVQDSGSVVCFDDIQAGTFTEHKEQFLCQLAEGPQNDVVTILCCNVPDTGDDVATAESLSTNFGDRIIDRLFDSSRWLVIRMTGESLRGQ